MKWTRRIKKKERICSVCRQVFESFREDAHLCSARCRKAWSRYPEVKQWVNQKRFRRLAAKVRELPTAAIEVVVEVPFSLPRRCPQKAVPPRSLVHPLDFGPPKKIERQEADERDIEI
jgi:hypothetical protein